MYMVNIFSHFVELVKKQKFFKLKMCNFLNIIYHFLVYSQHTTIS